MITSKLQNTSPAKSPYCDFNSHELWPEYRILYFPQDVSVILWERIFKKQIGSEDTHNRAYLFEINRHFDLIWAAAAHKLLDKLAKEFPQKMIDYQKSINELREIIKQELLLWSKECFHLSITSTDAVETVKLKLSKKENDIKEAIRGKWLEYIFGKGYSRGPSNMIMAQIDSMLYIVFKELSEDSTFLEILIKNNQKRITLSTQEGIRKICG